MRGSIDGGEEATRSEVPKATEGTSAGKDDGARPVAVLSRALNVTQGTLYAWRREALAAGVLSPGDGRNAEAWSGKAKFAAVLESAALSEAELGEYCRAKGLYPEQLRAWRQTCESAFECASPAKPQRKRLRELERELRGGAVLQGAN